MSVTQSKTQSSSPGPFFAGAGVLWPHPAVTTHATQAGYSLQNRRQNGSPPPNVSSCPSQDLLLPPGETQALPLGFLLPR